MAELFIVRVTWLAEEGRGTARERLRDGGSRVESSPVLMVGLSCEIT